MRTLESTALSQLSDVQNTKLQTPEGPEELFEKRQNSMFQDMPVFTD